MDFEQQLERVASTYRGQGYDIILHPGAAQLPSFAADFKVELLCRRGKEGVLVAVKENRDALSADENMQRYAEVTSSQPGWRFDFVVLEGENPKAREVRGAREFSGEDISCSLDQAERLSQLGFARSALVTAWGAFEAAMRIRLRASGQQAGWGSMPRQMVKELYSSGLMSADEFQEIEAGFQLRNQIVHGFSSLDLNAEDLESSAIQVLNKVAHRLLDESRAAKQAS